MNTSTAKALPLHLKWDAIPGGKCELSTATQTHTQRLSNEEVVPPAHVWDNISAILDEQDQQQR